MRISAGAVIPPLLLSSVVGWSVWPYWSPRSSTLAAKPKVTEIPSSLLTKAPDHSPDLDPFRSPIVAPAKEVDRTASKSRTAANVAPGIDRPELKPGAVSSSPRVASKPGLLARLTNLSAWTQDRVDWVRGQAAAAVRSQAAAQASIPGQVALSATSIRGKRRVAVINGLVYAEGDSLSGIAAPAAVILSAVRPGSVQLRSGVATVDIAFSTSSKSTGPAPAVAPRPRPAHVEVEVEHGPQTDTSTLI